MLETDSWIDVSSQPSDSQYTSSSDDHIITAGLRISQARRKRRGTARPTSHPQELLEPESSSDDDDDDDGEGEGEDMGTLIHSMAMSSDGYSSPDDDDEESDDEASASDSNGKALSSVQRPGVPYRRQTTPMASSSYNTRGSHAYSGFNSFAPNHATDHDAALRASLSTLLSCAAAARGLPKSSLSQTSPGSQSQHQGGRVAVDSLTLVREGGEPSSSNNRDGKPRSLSITSNATSSASRSPSSEQLVGNNAKKSSAAERKRSGKSSKSRRRSRTRNCIEEGEMSLSNISYMTLAISAGAIVVLSALTFSAGYALGREVGKGEGGLLSSVSRSAEGGKAVVKGTGRSIRMGTRFSSVAAF